MNDRTLFVSAFLSLMEWCRFKPLVMTDRVTICLCPSVAKGTLLWASSYVCGVRQKEKEMLVKRPSERERERERKKGLMID